MLYKMSNSAPHNKQWNIIMVIAIMLHLSPSNLVWGEGEGHNLLAYKRITKLKPVQNGHSKIEKNKDLNDNWKLNEGQKYCRMLPLEHFAILLTCIKRWLVLKNNLQSFWEWLLYTGFTVPRIGRSDRIHGKVHLNRLIISTSCRTAVYQGRDCWKCTISLIKKLVSTLDLCSL